MKTFPRPRVVVSKCIEFAPCRYNGAMISDEFVQRLKGYVDFRPVCPEMEIGLGCPRDPIRVVKTGGRLHLVQPSTERDITEAMAEFADRFLAAVGEVDGFLLKSRSPSCGIRDVEMFAGMAEEAAVEFGAGFFARAAIERFPDAPMEDEGQLAVAAVRERFLEGISERAAARRR